MFQQINPSHPSTVINKYHKPAKTRQSRFWGRTPYVRVNQGKRDITLKVVKIAILERNGKPFTKSDRKNGS